MVNKSILFLALSFLFVCCTNPTSDELYLNTIQANETGMADLKEAAKDSKTADALYATINSNETETALLKYIEDQAKTKTAFSIPSATMKPTKTKIPPTSTSIPTNTRKPATKTPIPANKPSTKVPSITTLGVQSNLVLDKFGKLGFDFEYGEEPSPGITRIVGTSPDELVFFHIDVIDGYVKDGAIWALWRYSNDQVIFQSLDLIDLFRDTLLPNWSSSYQWMENAMMEISDKLNSGKLDHGVSTSLNNANVKLHVFNTTDVMTLFIEAHK